MVVTTVALAAKGRLVGLLLALTGDPSVAPVDAPSAVDDASDDALMRLAAPIALALNALALGRDERRPRVRERMLATALAALDQPVFLLDVTGRVRDLSAAAVRVYALVTNWSVAASTSSSSIAMRAAHTVIRAIGGTRDR